MSTRRTALLGLALLVLPGVALSAVRRWDEVAKAPMGAGLEAVGAQLPGARLKKAQGPKGGERSSWKERVSFEGHTPASVTYRFIRGKLYEVDLQYLKPGRAQRVAAFLRKKFGEGKRQGKDTVFAAGDRRVAFRQSAGRVRIIFTSPEILAAERRPKKPSEDASEARGVAREKKRKARKKSEPTPSPDAAPRAPRQVLASEAEDPALWKALGATRGPIFLFRVETGGARRKVELVAAGFTRGAGPPLAAIVSREGGGYRVHHIGASCAGTPHDAWAVDFRFDENPDLAIAYRAEGNTRIALLPSAPRFAGAKLIGGRFAGRNAYACFRLGVDVRGLDFRDVDQDRSLDLLLSYDTEHQGPAHDVYFFQGTDFYFRETRPGLPRDGGAR